MIEIGGRNYPYVQIGNQLWLAENLDFLPNGLTLGSDARYYNNAATPLRLGAGLLYNQSAFSILGANLPNRWRIPTKADIDILIAAVGGSTTAGTKLKSSEVWLHGTGTDDYGFAAIPCGMYRQGLGFDFGNDRLTLATQTIYDTGRGPWFLMITPSSDVLIDWDGGTRSSRSIRLVKDIP